MVHAVSTQMEMLSVVVVNIQAHIVQV